MSNANAPTSTAALPSPREVALRRAMLPEFMAAEDVAAVTLTGVSAARRAMRRGTFGPVARIGRRLFVHRDGFLEAFHARASDPKPRPGPIPQGPPPAWARSLIGRRGGVR